jgi:hypothetical protein
VALGLIATSVIVLTQVVATNVAGLAILTGAAAAFLGTRLNTMLVLAVAMLLGALFLQP